MSKKLLHANVINRKTNYVPLLVSVIQPNPKPYTAFDAMRNPEYAIENSNNNFEFTKQIDSDIVPHIESNFMECLVPSIFGSETHCSPGGLIDVKPKFKDIYETEKINITDIFTGEMENAIKHLQYLKANAPEYLYLNPTRPMSPLDYAVVLCGGEFYTDLLAEPELALNFMEKIADVTIKTIKYFKQIIEQPLNECATVRGLIYPGIRLTGDAVVNLSPTMIKELMCPIYKKFEEEFDKVMLHYCCLPAPSNHVIDALAIGGSINCVDNWQGYKTLIGKNELQTDVSICTDVKSDEITSGEIWNNPFFTLNDRPLIVSTRVNTVDEGKQVYEIWRDQYDK